MRVPHCSQGDDSVEGVWVQHLVNGDFGRTNKSGEPIGLTPGFLPPVELIP